MQNEKQKYIESDPAL